MDLSDEKDMVAPLARLPKGPILSVNRCRGRRQRRDGQFGHVRNKAGRGIDVIGQRRFSHSIYSCNVATALDREVRWIKNGSLYPFLTRYALALSHIEPIKENPHGPLFTPKRQPIAELTSPRLCSSSMSVTFTSEVLPLAVTFPWNAGSHTPRPKE